MSKRSLGFASLLATLSLLASGSSAAASVTIGQLAPPTPPVSCTGVDSDNVQPTVSSGTAYVVPALPPATALVISSWSHSASAAATGQMLTMKVFRKVADPATYQVVGHDGPRPLIASTVNTFPVTIPVQPGDVLGLNSAAAAMTACAFSAPGESRLIRIGNLADGESGGFSPASPDYRTNISAAVSASNTFSLGKGKLNKKKGTRIITATVPNPGKLIVQGKGVKTVRKTVGVPGKLKLLVKARKKKRKKLDQKGKVKVAPAITYKPTRGDPNTQSIKLKLKKQHKKAAQARRRRAEGLDTRLQPLRITWF